MKHFTKINAEDTKLYMTAKKHLKHTVLQ